MLEDAAPWQNSLAELHLLKSLTHERAAVGLLRALGTLGGHNDL